MKSAMATTSLDAYRAHTPRAACVPAPATHQDPSGCHPSSWSSCNPTREISMIDCKTKVREAFAKAAKTRDDFEALELVARQFGVTPEAVAEAVREVAGA